VNRQGRSKGGRGYPGPTRGNYDTSHAHTGLIGKQHWHKPRPHWSHWETALTQATPTLVSLGNSTDSITDAKPTLSKQWRQNSSYRISTFITDICKI